MIRRLALILTLLAAAPLCILLGYRGVGASAPRAAQPKVALAFTQLPLGSVEPRGWLRDWAQAAREGITGHLDEVHPTFADGWKSTPIAAPGANPDGTGWPLEQCAYWLDGALRLGILLHDRPLIDKVARRLDIVVSGTLAHKTTLIWWKDRDVLKPGKKKQPNFNNWAHSHMARALLAYYQYSGDRRILDALAVAYRDFPMSELDGVWRTTYGVTNVDPMLELYGLTGDPKPLAAALGVTRQENFRLVCEESWPNEQMEYASGHGVLFIEQCRVPALLYPWTGQRWMLDASLRSFEWVERTHMLPCGVPSSEEYLAGVGAFRCVETCDIPCWIWSQAELMRIVGEGSAGDKIERAFFNAGPAPIARDWKTMSYYQSPNRISPTLPGSSPKHPTGSKGKENSFAFTRLGYDNVLCCVGNANRIIPFFVENMWQRTPDGGLAATLYGPCAVSANAVGSGKVAVKIACETNYPFEEEIHVKVDPARAASFPLYFRVPSWCATPRIQVGGAEVTAAPDAHGFVKIAREWKASDLVTLRFPMSVAVERGRETPYPQIEYFKRVGADDPLINNPYAAVHYGPLLFALPIPDADANTPASGEARWRYALDNDGRKDGKEIKVVRAAMPGHWSWQLDAPLALEAPARAFDWQPTDAQPLPKAPVKGGAESATIRLVPYGCTRFRVSMFPVTERAWAGMN